MTGAGGGRQGGRRGNAAAVLAFTVALSSGCSRTEEPPERLGRAAFGVFFGGQVQQRQHVPFELDPAKQTVGFRIDFSEPLKQDVKVEWALELPPGSRGRNAAGRQDAGRRGRAHARAGQERFEKVLPFEPGDPLGLWNVRVVVEGKVLIDRPFEVYDAAERARAMRRDAGR